MNLWTANSQTSRSTPSSKFKVKYELPRNKTNVHHWTNEQKGVSQPQKGRQEDREVKGTVQIFILISQDTTKALSLPFHLYLPDPLAPATSSHCSNKLTRLFHALPCWLPLPSQCSPSPPRHLAGNTDPTVLQNPG